MMPNTRSDTTHKKGLKIIIPKQILQRLTVALAKAKADDTSED